MIVNAWTIVALFLACVSGALALALLAVLARAGARRGLSATQRWDADGPMIGLLLGTLIALQIVAWPHFYLLLASYVPALSEYGVMCAYGVTRIQPELVTAIQILAPVVLFTGGLWFALASASGATAPKARGLLAAATGLLVLAGSSAELAYILAHKVGQQVTCCTQYLETEAAAPGSGADLAARSIGGGALFVGVQLLILVGVVFLAPGPATRLRGPLPVALAALGIGNLLVTYDFWREQLAPHVLQLPYHRCIYELLTDTRALGLAAVLTIAGNAVLAWPPLLRGTAHADAVARRIYRFALIAALSSHLIVVLHLLPFG